MPSSLRRSFACCILLVLAPSVVGAEPAPLVLSDDGGWCWFEDERVLVHDGRLLIGTIAAGTRDPSRKGNVELTTVDLQTRTVERSVLHRGFPTDDHNSPALLARGDGCLIAMYSQHGAENRIYARIGQQPGVPSSWGEEQVFVPGPKSRVTYSNLFHLSDENQGRGRLYNFYRGYDDTFKPSWMTSDNDGDAWTAHGLWIDFVAAQRHRPYVKYAANGRDTIHFAFTEGHPRDFDNSIYHAYYRDGAFFRSDGARIKAVSDGPITPGEATRVFAGDPANVAWISDMHLDAEGRPVLVYSVQKNAAGLGPAHPQAGQDHRYRYACWNGKRWRDQEIAYAGTRLYPGEDDYTGNLCLDPYDLNIVYVSSNVDIRSGCPNASGHYEIYRGQTHDRGAAWDWTPLTRNSHVDNLRPIAPAGDGSRGIVLWLRGKYVTYRDYDLQVVGVLGDRHP